MTTDQLQLELTPAADLRDDEEPEPVIPRLVRGQLRELPGTTWEDIFK